jgi:hypothetical protein
MMTKHPNLQKTSGLTINALKLVPNFIMQETFSHVIQMKKIDIFMSQLEIDTIKWRGKRNLATKKKRTRTL